MIKTFVVSLKDSNRRKFISKELKEYSFDFFDAVNGNDLSQEKLEDIKIKNIDFWMNEYKRPLSNGEIGCSLSHISIYEKMINEDINWAIIFEDDINVNNINFQKLIKKEKLNDDYIYILGSQDGIGYSKFFIYNPFNSLNIGNNIKLRKLIDSEKYLFRTSSYIISKKTAEKIFFFNKKYFSQSDSWEIFKKNNLLKGFYFTDTVSHPDVHSGINQSLLEEDRVKLSIMYNIKCDPKKSLIPRLSKSFRKKISKLSKKIVF